MIINCFENKEFQEAYNSFRNQGFNEEKSREYACILIRVKELAKEATTNFLMDDDYHDYKF